MQKIFNLFDFSQKVDYKNEVLAGLTVAMTMIPESLSFAILAGFPPLVGLYAAFIMGIMFLRQWPWLELFKLPLGSLNWVNLFG